MLPSIAQAGARIANLDDLYDSRVQWIREHTRPFITAVTPFESRDIGEQLTGTDCGFTTVIFHRLKGMTEQEMAEYVPEIMNRNMSRLTAAQITQYSLGIPLLAQQLLHGEVTEQTAAQMSADYLRFASMYPYARPILNQARPFLNMPLPNQTIASLDEIAGDGRERHIYGHLYSALARREELRKQGVYEESPFFVASESEAIYDAMMALAGKRASAYLEIVAPNLTPEDLERIQQALGQSWEGYNQSRSTRMKMFRNAEYRKAGIWTGDSAESLTYMDGESANMNDIATGYIRAIQAGRLPFELADGPMLVIHKHAHSDQSDEVALFGWMAESLLQQRGIGYFANNHVYGRSYIYNPQTKRIEEFAIFKNW